MGRITGKIITLAASLAIAAAATLLLTTDTSTQQSYDPSESYTNWIVGADLYAAPKDPDIKGGDLKKKKQPDPAMERCAAKCKMACKGKNGCKRAHLIGGSKCKWYCKTGDAGESELPGPRKDRS